MRQPGTKVGLQFVLLLIALSAASILHAQEYSTAALAVCNKGTAAVNVVIAKRLATLSDPLWHVDGWTLLHPGNCSLIYQDSEIGYQVSGEPAYLGFAFYDAHDKLVTGTVNSVPDFGFNANNLVQMALTGSKGSNVLTKSDKRLCVSENKTLYNIKDLTQADCAGYHPEGNVGPFFSFAAALYFRPVTSSCFELDCHGGGYTLDVAPRPTDEDGNLHASVGSGSGGSSAANANEGLKMIADFLVAAAKAGKEERQKQVQAEAAAAEAHLQQARDQQTAREEQQKRIKAAAAASDPTAKSLAQIVDRNDENNRQRWAGSRQSPASYDPQWMGQTIVVVGTVSRVEVAPGGSPQWVTIYFKESPDAAFVVCSPYPDLFQEKVGLDLSVLVGKTLEAAGQVESPYCGHKVPKGSIRVVESKQWQLH
jgi:hypothetical protein